ncbi:hypothetical protein N7491_003083 [Penicillium cf. griseofulvum]|nr:hypothetical protein N7491_003083 [Penicillium cf. griseofulvum]
MSRPGDFDHLCGAEVKLEQPFPRAIFVFNDKLFEEFQTMTQEEIDDDFGHPFAAIKFLRDNLSDPTQRVRAQQAITQHTHAKVNALISFDNKKCTAVPKLLGYGNRVQGEGDYVPGGYINYVAWMRVAGEPIDSVSYWKRDIVYRDEVHSAFRAAYR